MKALRHGVAALFGVLVAVAATEFALRAAGVVVIRRQEAADRRAFAPGDPVRILCLGESTTLGQYPAYLAQFLKDEVPGGVVVIDKGFAGLNTTYLLDHIEEFLTEYRPQIVVTMLGVNDKFWSPPGRFFENLRVYKLIRLAFGPKAPRAGPDSVNLIDTAKFEARRSELQALVAREPRNDEALGELAHLYEVQKRWPEALAHFRKASALAPENLKWRLGLGRVYAGGGDGGRALRAFTDVLKRQPGQGEALGRAVELLRGRGRFAEAEALYENALRLDPENAKTLLDCAMFYGAIQRWDKMGALTARLEALDPPSSAVWSQLARLYNKQAHEARDPESARKATRFLEKAVALDPGNAEAQSGLINAKTRSARPFTGDFGPATAENMLRLRDRVLARGAMLVCSQYPTLPVGPLKELLGEGPGIYFVDNEESFKRGVDQEGYDAYFRDAFARTWGHCTEKGNRLLAGNIARVIRAAPEFIRLRRPTFS
jgi:tetratricopeptide (TPR) repeat protein